MTVNFYLHTDMPIDMNERLAACIAARQLLRRLRVAAETYHVVFNIDPAKDSRLREMSLTQLDGLIIGPNFVSLLEFKGYFEPIHGELKGNWYAGQKYIGGGKRKNPYLQIKHAREKWIPAFQLLTEQLFSPQRAYTLRPAWHHLSGYILFSPFLHSKSNVPDLGGDRKWLHVDGVDRIAELMFVTRSQKLRLFASEMQRFIENGIGARLWSEFNQLLETRLGYIYIQEPGKPAVREVLFYEDEFTIGRARSQRYSVPAKFGKISREHARVTVQNGQVRLADSGSSHGTFLNGNRVDEHEGVIFRPEVKAQLGAQDNQSLIVWYELEDPMPPDKIVSGTL